MTLKAFLIQEGYEPTNDGINKFIEDNNDMLMDSVQPALCEEGCEVEPDGYCSHGKKSISLALGVI